MKDRIEVEETGQSGRFGSRSRVLLEIGLWVYAVASAIVLTRIVLLALNVQGEIWIIRFVQTLSNPVARTLQQIPGGNTTIVGSLTLADLTLLVLVGLVPLVLIALGRPAADRRRL